MHKTVDASDSFQHRSDLFPPISQKRQKSKQRHSPTSTFLTEEILFHSSDPLGKMRETDFGHSSYDESI